MLLLAIVAPRPTHGSAIIDTLRQRSGGAFGLHVGTIDPV